jgi:diguanylate cyclase (GGDEF)-like protein/PAS domain S-box-containing protein
MRSLDDVQTLGQFVRNLREGVYITTEAGRILDANPAFLRMFGVSSLAELQSHTATSLVVDPERRADEARILRAEGAVREFELEIRRPDGNTRTVLDTAYQVTDDASGEVLYHGILVDITDRKILERQLRDLTIRDPLTGCHNRRFLQETLHRLDQDAAPIGVIVIDVDHFKDTNDRLGHDAGDRLLVQLGRFLTQQVRVEDPVVRTGGDEFAILLPGLDLSGTLEVVGRLRQHGPGGAPVSFTLGWAVRDGREPVADTMRRADQFLLRVRIKDRQLAPRIQPILDDDEEGSSS